jgi:malate dehydrogenase
LSQTKLDLSKQDIEALTHKIQFGGDEVVKAKNGTGSATLSMAHAGAKMANSVLRALAGQSNIYEYSFVHTGGKIGGLEYFSTKVLLGKNGIEEVLDPGSMTAYEKSLYDQAVPELAKNISKGIGFA